MIVTSYKPVYIVRNVFLTYNTLFRMKEEQILEPIFPRRIMCNCRLYMHIVKRYTSDNYFLDYVSIIQTTSQSTIECIFLWYFSWKGHYKLQHNILVVCMHSEIKSIIHNYQPNIFLCSYHGPRWTFLFGIHMRRCYRSRHERLENWLALVLRKGQTS